MLCNDTLEERYRDRRIPDALRIDHHDRAIRAHTQARYLPPFHPLRAKKEAGRIQKRGERRIQRASRTIGSAESSRAHQHVVRIGIHLGSKIGRAHSCCDKVAGAASSAPLPLRLGRR